MISPETRAETKRLFHADHWKIGAIARHLGIHHGSVKRILGSQAYTNRRYRKGSLDKWEDYIIQTLEQYPKIRATRLLQMLESRGYEGSVYSVRRAVKKSRPNLAKAYMAVTVFPGEQGQVDWGSFGKIDVRGHQRRLSCFVMVLSYSRAIFARFTYDQTLESLLACHQEAFHYFQGIPRRILYDNMKTAVIERQGSAIKFNSGLLEFSGDYHFEPWACSPFSGHEKGRVERSIRYIRDNFFTAREFKDLSDANAQLDHWRDEVANKRLWPQDRVQFICDIYAKEKEQLLKLPGSDTDVFLTKITKSGKTPYIRYDLNDYSIPHKYVRQPLTLRANRDEIRIFFKSDQIACHKRQWGKGFCVENADHIEALVKHRHEAASHNRKSQILRELPEMDEIFRRIKDRGDQLAANGKLFHKLIDQYGIEEFKKTIATALERNTPTAESFEFLLSRAARDSNTPIRKPLRLPCRSDISEMQIKSHDPSIYDDLF